MGQRSGSWWVRAQATTSARAPASCSARHRSRRGEGRRRPDRRSGRGRRPGPGRWRSTRPTVPSPLRVLPDVVQEHGGGPGGVGRGIGRQPLQRRDQLGAIRTRHRLPEFDLGGAEDPRDSSTCASLGLRANSDVKKRATRWDQGGRVASRAADEVEQPWRNGSNIGLMRFVENTSRSSTRMPYGRMRYQLSRYRAGSIRSSITEPSSGGIGSRLNNPGTD